MKKTRKKKNTRKVSKTGKVTRKEKKTRNVTAGRKKPFANPCHLGKFNAARSKLERDDACALTKECIVLLTDHAPMALAIDGCDLDSSIGI